MARIHENEMRKHLKLYFICGTTTSPDPLTKVLQSAINGGITLFQYREKGVGALSGAEKESLGRDLRDICRNAGIPFIVNDDLDLALKLSADGLHIGQDDGNVSDIRKKLGDKILGVSAHTKEEAQQALLEGADYLGVGPVFPTTTKKDTEKVCSPGFIKKLRQGGINCPIVAIGGISTSNVAEVAKSDADGISVISAISKSDNPVMQTRELLRIWEETNHNVHNH
ncbi:thiamine phosphate synthase [Evansella tamaricis]|uniref:Thiamine-phosphate synthase n=1 Tax=Evansella tamaricis TaxID=2069301 RepID=A0ABS6JAL5_9BACI|nr:thiamine phosphate synthase [Evansella tamaricis]MBU9710553.1 thiamine phosphate synthase [Evansella tamaricis]